MTKEALMSPEFDKRIPAALLILRFFLATFLLQWSIEKLILPDAAARIASNFYGVTLPVAGSYALGIAELIVSLALLVGFQRTISYGLSLLIHTVTVVVSWRQLFDPWGLAKVGNHLWISTWPTWGGFAALFLMREWDTWTLDGWRQNGGWAATIGVVGGVIGLLGGLVSFRDRFYKGRPAASLTTDNSSGRTLVQVRIKKPRSACLMRGNNHNSLSIAH